ncbi:MAG TPA: MBL fold metallo-hydrolase [Anaeromyxobacteraceae bacterium]|nr:MBL fold metallo-hydrolase [Anaeromyxobacteraceae bacterium]
MLADSINDEKTFVGEWGFSAVVEANGQRVLFDTGASGDTVLRNAAVLGIDLSSITDVIVSHFHEDHAGGLPALRRELASKNPAALSRAHVLRGFFWPRTTKEGKPYRSVDGTRAAYEAAGGKFVEHDAPFEILPGVWLTGPVPRVHPERNYPQGIIVKTPQGTVTDDVPEDDALVLDSTDGLVVVTGCGHAGVTNILEAARKVVRPDAHVSAVFGGLHLLSADDATLDWTGSQFKRFGVAHVVGAHCTGIEAVYRLRQAAGLDRKRCVVGAVGTSFDIAKGIVTTRLTR